MDSVYIWGDIFGSEGIPTGALKVATFSLREAPYGGGSALYDSLAVVSRRETLRSSPYGRLKKLKCLFSFLKKY